jgi:tetratricopeptide (TPR) repeat protein
MKIAFALTRKEADIYRSQGLHKEARELYGKFLACSTKIDPGTKTMIEKQIQLIELEMNCGDPGAPQELSADQIELIKKGWGANASESDLFICAQAFMEIGRYVDALREFRNMIIKGSEFEPLSWPITDCFLHLFDPQKLPSKVDRYANALYRDQDSILMFQISIAEQLLNYGRSNHALSFYHHLCRTPSGSKNIQSRLTALGTKLNARSAQHPANPESLETQVAASQHRSSFVQIGSALNSLILKVMTIFKFR